MLEDIPEEEQRRIELENATLSEKSLAEISDTLKAMHQLLKQYLENKQNQKST